MNQPDPTPSKTSILISDCLMIVFTLAACVGFIVVLFLGGIIGICSIQWMIKSFIIFDGSLIAKGFFFSLLCLGCGVLFVFLAVRIAMATKQGAELYLTERKRPDDASRS